MVPSDNCMLSPKPNEFMVFHPAMQMAVVFLHTHDSTATTNADVREGVQDVGLLQDPHVTTEGRLTVNVDASPAVQLRSFMQGAATQQTHAMTGIDHPAELGAENAH